MCTLFRLLGVVRYVTSIWNVDFVILCMTFIYSLFDGLYWILSKQFIVILWYNCEYLLHLSSYFTLLFTGLRTTIVQVQSTVQSYNKLSSKANLKRCVLISVLNCVVNVILNRELNSSFQRYCKEINHILLLVFLNLILYSCQSPLYISKLDEDHTFQYIPYYDIYWINNINKTHR